MKLTQQLVILLLIVLIIASCKKSIIKNTDFQPTKEVIDTTKFYVEVTDSIININGQQVKIGDSINTWVKVLGKYNRRFKSDINNVYIWDSLGIKLHSYYRHHELSPTLIRRFFICYIGLESPKARTGKMRGLESYNFSNKFKDSLTVVTRYLNRHKKRKDTQQVIKDANKYWTYIKDDQDYRKYKYPLKNFSGNLYINNIKTDTSYNVKTLNQKRHNNGDNMFSYYDNTSYGFGAMSDNRTGETEETYNTGDYSALPKKVSRNHPIFYKVRFYENKLYEAEIGLLPPKYFK